MKNLILAASLLALTACGGGGGGSTAPTASKPATVQPTAPKPAPKPEPTCGTGESMYAGECAVDFQVTVLNTDIYKSVDGKKSHGEETGEIFDEVFAGGNTKYLTHIREESVIGTAEGNVNLHSLRNQAAEPIDILWTAHDNISTRAENTLLKMQEFSQEIQDRDILVIYSLDNITGKASSDTCDNDLYKCEQIAQELITKEKTKAQSIAAAAITGKMHSVDNKGFAVELAHASIDKNGKFMPETLFVPEVQWTSFAAAKLGAYAAKLKFYLNNECHCDVSAIELHDALMGEYSMDRDMRFRSSNLQTTTISVRVLDINKIDKLVK